ncbi:hypothetical protein [Clostridium butyricum]|uniref:hypothetical protein n=1 Tax=Clostridium butyricum TaxID=1492 RepID=UPI000DE952F8|nr:hypothetical protein [Clostridium butyricum]AXB84578.1 hypothetical protein DRB99_06245 [Clostridium butyricum]
MISVDSLKFTIDSVTNKYKNPLNDDTTLSILGAEYTKELNKLDDLLVDFWIKPIYDNGNIKLEWHYKDKVIDNDSYKDIVDFINNIK